MKTRNGQVNNTIMFTLVCSYTYSCCAYDMLAGFQRIDSDGKSFMLSKTFQHYSKTIHDDMYGSHPSGCMQGNRVGVQKSERTSEKASVFV